MKFIGIGSILFFSFLVIVGSFLWANGPQRWVVYYNDEAPYEQFANFDVIVFDTNSHPLLNPGKTNLGYISAGELEKWRPYYREAKERGVLINKNPEWEDSFFVDLRNPAWKDMVINEMVPIALSQGFNGVFLDTLDNAEYLETLDPKKYAGMKKAAIELVKEIRQRFPSMLIMVNRGFDLYPEIALDVNMVAAESTYADFNFKTKKYEIVPEEEHKEYVEVLRKIQKANPNIKIYTIDYWDPEDKEGIRKIYEVQRKLGFIPYVSTVDLQTVFIEE